MVSLLDNDTLRLLPCIAQMNSFKKEVDGMFGGSEKEQVYLDDTPDVQYSKVHSSTCCLPVLRHPAALYL
jgi:hypothetical protein